MGCMGSIDERSNGVLSDRWQGNNDGVSLVDMKELQRRLDLSISKLAIAF